MFNTKLKKEEPVIISPSFQLPIILIISPKPNVTIAR